jgi:hypothetical protein
VKTPELAGDIIAGSTAFAGLIIVYVGSVATAYSGYQKTEQKSVRAKFLRRASIAAIGVGLAALSAALALLGKWAESNWMVGTAAVLMIVTLAWGVGVTAESVRELR